MRFSINYSISQDGSAGFTVTVGGASKSGVAAGGEGHSTWNSNSTQTGFVLYAIDSTKNGQSVTKFGANEQTTKDGNYTIKIDDQQFVEDIEHTNKD